MLKQGLHVLRTAFAVSCIQLSLCFQVYNPNDPTVVGLPFNLPNTRYCSPCTFSKDITHHADGVDKLCLDYAYANVENEGRPANFDTMKMTLALMQRRRYVYFYLLESYIKAKDLFVQLFNSSYVYSVFVHPTPNKPSCIQIFQEGTGFLKRMEDAKQSNRSDISVQQNRLYKEGVVWETRFLVLMKDIWIKETCKGSHNSLEINRAKHDFINATRQGRSMLTHLAPLPNMTTPYIKPGVSGKFARACGDNTTTPAGVATDVIQCQNTFCPSTATRPDVNPSSNCNADTINCDGSNARRFVINEFYPYNSGNPTASEFIEIRAFPPKVKDSTCFPTLRIIAFTVYERRLVLTINLYNKEIPNNGFFVVEGSDSGKNYIQTAVDVIAEYKLLPSGAEPIAIVLLQKKSTGYDEKWDKLQLHRKSNKRYSVLMTESKHSEMLKSMKNYIIDAVFYGELKNDKVPDEVLDLLPTSEIGCNFIVPIGDPSSEEEIRSSLNLCREFDPPAPFQYAKFKLGTPTMRATNDCSRTMFQVLKVEQSTLETSNTVGVTTTPYVGQDCPNPNDKIGFLHNEIHSQIKYMQNQKSAYESPYYPTNKFRKNIWPPFLQRYATTMDLGGDLQPFERATDGQVTNPLPGATYFVCSLCHARHKRCPTSIHYNQMKEGFANGQQLPTDSLHMFRAFESHLNSQLHLTSILYEVEKERIKIENEYYENNPYRFNQTARFRNMANIMDITYTFLHTNTAPSNSVPWYRVLRKIKAEVGSSHHSKKTAFAIINFIADVGTNAIMEQLIANDDPFSLILDGSADSRNHHYVVVYLQCLEGGVTIPYFLFLLELTSDFDANNYLTTLRSAVEAKGLPFKNYFERRLVGIMTDSASVMKKFHKDLNKNWIKRTDYSGKAIDLISIFCLAHKLQLATRSSIVPLKRDSETPVDPYFSTLEKFMQSCYVWFKWSGKRIGLFREISKLPHVEMKELHLERWISSEYKTVKNFILSWETARSAIEIIIRENKLDRKTVAEATSYLPQFKDKTALITIHFLWDYTSVFKIWSEHLQKMSGLIIDQKKYYKQLMENFNKLQEFRSPVISSFLKTCKCGTEECSLDTYISSDIVVWNGMEFSDQTNEGPTKFRSAVDSLMVKSRERLAEYIPLDLIYAADVLRPQSFPPGEMSLSYQHPKLGDRNIYGETEIQTLAELLGFDKEQILVDWATLFQSMQLSASWQTVRKISDANMFWAMQLRDTSLTWTPNLMLFIKSMKILAPGSVACETGFSIFNVIKAKSRANLKDTHVDSIMKILINGPGNVEHFDSYRYANYWLLAGHRLPNDEEADEEVCRPVQDNTHIVDDVEFEETEIEMFPGRPLTQLYSDAYTEFVKSEEFEGTSKQQRSASRYRSKIM